MVSSCQNQKSPEIIRTFLKSFEVLKAKAVCEGAWIIALDHGQNPNAMSFVLIA
jgi:hypothetical protein